MYLCVEDLHHLAEVGAQPVDRRGLAQAAVLLGARVEAVLHDPHAERVVDRSPGARGVEPDEVALGHVDQVTDDVPGFPFRTGGLAGPRPVLRHLEQRVGFPPEYAEQVLLGGVVGRVPVVHDDLRWSVGSHPERQFITRKP
jgi:hypothetical protein